MSSFALLEHRFEFFFERSWRNVEHVKSRQVVRGCGVDLHKLDLMAGEWGVRQDFSDAGKCIPHLEGSTREVRRRLLDNLCREPQVEGKPRDARNLGLRYPAGPDRGAA